MLDCIVLQGIHQPNGAAQIAARHQPRRSGPGGIRGPRKLADAVGELLRHLFRIEFEFRIEHPALVLPDALHLRDLFLQGHARQQILDARLDAGGGILVGRLVGRGRGVACGEDAACEKDADGKSYQPRDRCFHRESPKVSQSAFFDSATMIDSIWLCQSFAFTSPTGVKCGSALYSKLTPSNDD
jgi:hypothetical protein